MTYVPLSGAHWSLHPEERWLRTQAVSLLAFFMRI
jgi:hypothetical protein